MAAVVGVEVAVLVLGAVTLPAVVHSLAGFERGEGEGGGEEGEEKEEEGGGVGDGLHVLERFKFSRGGG